MLDVSFTELLLIIVVAVIFIGPKDLPVVIRSISKAYAQVRKFMREIHATFEEVAKESGIHDVKDEFKRETTWLEGEDGDLHEAYDISDLLPEFEKKKVVPLQSRHPGEGRDPDTAIYSGMANDPHMKELDPGLRRDDGEA